MATKSQAALDATVRAVIGAGRAYDFDVLWPYSTDRGMIIFERPVSHGRGRARTYDRLIVTIDAETGDVDAARVRREADGEYFFAEDQAGRHPFDVVDALLLEVDG